MAIKPPKRPKKFKPRPQDYVKGQDYTQWAVDLMNVSIWRLTLRLLHFRWVRWWCFERGHRPLNSMTWKCECLARYDYGRWLTRWLEKQGGDWREGA
jgi:hypothetical protein